jgi:hypothetical protein
LMTFEFYFFHSFQKFHPTAREIVYGPLEVASSHHNNFSCQRKLSRGEDFQSIRRRKKDFACVLNKI